MAANWEGFISGLSDFLSSKSSSGPQDTGNKIASFYIDALKSSQTPTGNTFNLTPGTEALKQSFGLVFENLSKSNSPTVEEKKKDPAFKPAPDQKLPNEQDSKKQFEEDFKTYLRDSKKVKFQYYEITDPFSEYVLETNPANYDAVIQSRGTNVTNLKKADYQNELAIYEKLKSDYVNGLSSEKDNKNTKSDTKQKDPYDDMAKSIVAFWATSGPIVFGSLPPIPPATSPAPGTYSIIYPGNPVTLADGIRRAFNIGLQDKYQKDETGKEAAQAISKALALVLAKHLFSLKFTYAGAIGTAPSVSIVPYIF